MPPVRAVLFDLGDTLWHSPCPPPDEARLAHSGERVAVWLAERGLSDIEPSMLARDIRDAGWSATWAAYESDLRGPDTAALVRRVAAEHNVQITPAEAESLWWAVCPAPGFYKYELLPNALPVLRELRGRGYSTAVVTNRAPGGPPFVEELRLCGLLDLFDAHVVSADHGWMKPAPELFQVALQALNVEPHEAVMVGDSLRADVWGAQQFGMSAVWKRPAVYVPERFAGGVEAPVLPDAVIDNLTELLDLELLMNNVGRPRAAGVGENA